MASYKRINIIGSSGSGKSTFARQLADHLNYPFIEMDQIFWGPNWDEPSDEIFFNKLSEQLNQEKWVLDGNYSRAVPIKWENVQVVVWLDYSFPRTLFQSLKRAIHRSWTKKELWPGTGNHETFKKSFFSKGSILWWMLTNYFPVRKKYLKIMQDERFKHIQFVHLKNPGQARRFLQTL